MVVECDQALQEYANVRNVDMKQEKPVVYHVEILNVQSAALNCVEQINRITDNIMNRMIMLGEFHGENKLRS